MTIPSLIPSELDWAGYENDVDASWAHSLFFGKSAEDVIEQFQANAVDSAENIHRMPKAPFEYYLMAFAKYVLSIDASRTYDAADAASCLLNYVLLNIKQNPSKLNDIYLDLMPIVDVISKSQEKYDAPESIYGDFKNIRDEIANLSAQINESK